MAERVKVLIILGMLSDDLEKRLDDEMVVGILDDKVLSKNEDDFKKHVDKLIVLSSFGRDTDWLTENSAIFELY